MSASIGAGLLRLIAAQVSVNACMTGFRMAAPLMALRAGHSALAAGMLLALFALAQVFLALPAGRYVDRRGLKKPVRLAVVVASMGGALAVAWPVFGVLCVTALSCGAAAGLTMIALQRHVGGMARNPTELKQVFSWMAIGPSVSNFIGPLLAGVLIDAQGFRAAYLALVLLPGLAWLCLRGVPERELSGTGQSSAGSSSWDLLRRPGFARLILVNWMLGACWDVHTFLVPVLGHERGLSATVIGTILGSFALAATSVRLLMPWLAAHLREAVVVASAMVATALLFALYPLMQGAWGMGALSLLLGAVLGSVQPMIMSMLHQMTPAHRHGQALGLRAMVINGSSVAMPLLFGSVGAVVGLSVVFWTVGAVVALGSRLAWGLRDEDGARGLPR